MVGHYGLSTPGLVDQLAAIAGTMNSLYSLPKSRLSGGINTHRHRNLPNSSISPNVLACPQFSTSFVIDVVVLIAVTGAFGFLLYPSIKFMALKSIVAIEMVFYAVRDEISHDPLIYGSLGLSMLFSCLAMWVFVMCTMSRTCRNPNCKGLRRAAEFDIQIENEDCMKSPSAPNGSSTCRFELPANRQQELEAELRKIAPPNGRVVVVFRARCGCSVRMLEVPGAKKPRKIKK